MTRRLSRETKRYRAPVRRYFRWVFYGLLLFYAVLTIAYIAIGDWHDAADEAGTALMLMLGWLLRGWEATDER